MRSILAALLLFVSSASAQQIVQGAQLNIMLPLGTPCFNDTSRGAGGLQIGNQTLDLEKYADYPLPNPVGITRVLTWIEGVDPIGSATYGNITMAIDPGRSYTNSAGFPVNQNTTIVNVDTIGLLQLFPQMQVIPHGPQYDLREFYPPKPYYAGDTLLYAPECMSAPHQTLLTYVAVNLQGPIDTTPYPYLMNIPTASELMVVVNTPYSIRNLVPGPSVATTKFRARLFLPQNVSSSGWSYIAHCSVGIQSGNTSSTLATPVELTINHMSGTALYPTKWEWTDTVDLPAAPGQNYLVTCDMNRPSPDGHYYVGYTNSGYGEWDTVNVANWNNAVMQGSVVYQPTRTHIIDRAQAW